MTADRNAMVKLTELWERTSANGNTYYSGYLGAAQVLLFREGPRPHPKRPDEEVIVWNLLIQERDSAPRPSTRNVERGQRSWDAARRIEPHATRSRAQAAGEAIVAERCRSQEPPTDWMDDTDAAIRDLTEGPGR